MDLLKELFHHNTMMNDRLVEVCRPLSVEQLAATAVGTYGPIGATLVHIANSQNSYTTRFLGSERGERLDEDPFPGFDALAEHMTRGNVGLEHAATMAAEDAEVTVHGDDPVGSWTMHRSLLLLQALNHGMEHRSQVATILTQLGIEPPAMDGWTYFFDSGHMHEI